MSNPLYILAGQSNAGSIMMLDYWDDIAGEKPDYSLLSVVEGGSPLNPSLTGNDWYPVDDGATATGELFRTLQDTIRGALASGNSHLAGIVWIQGESDTHTLSDATAYGDLLETMFDILSQEFGEDFTLAMALLPSRAPTVSDPDRFGFWQDLRDAQIVFAQAQARVAAVDPDNVIAVIGGDVNRAFGDHIHYGNALADGVLRDAIRAIDTGSPIPLPPRILGDDDPQRLDGAHAGDILIALGGADFMLGFAGDDAMYGGEGDDRMFGGAGNDTLVGGGGIDFMAGNEGDDVYFVDHVRDNVVETRDAGFDVVFTTANWIARADVESVIATGDAGAVRLTGHDDGIVLVGATGDDVLVGGDGADDLAGNDGNDVLRGGAGDDRLDGGSGFNRYFGGLGDDLYVIFNASDRIWEHENEGFDRLSARVGYSLNPGVEVEVLLIHARAGDAFLVANDFDQTLLGNEDANVLFGQGGDDRLFGQGGDDMLDGGEGHDRLSGGAGADVLRGGNGNDLLDGGTEADFLFGDAGDDTIVGANGDRMLGGAGADTFVFAPASGRTVIADLDGTEDRIDLSAYGLLGIEQLTLRQVGDRVDVNIGDTGDVLILRDFDIASLPDGVFIF